MVWCVPYGGICGAWMTQFLSSAARRMLSRLRGRPRRLSGGLLRPMPGGAARAQPPLLWRPAVRMHAPATLPWWAGM